MRPNTDLCILWDGLQEMQQKGMPLEKDFPFFMDKRTKVRDIDSF